MALNPTEYPGVPGGRATLIARLPLQALFVYWVWLATLKDDLDPKVVEASSET